MRAKTRETLELFVEKAFELSRDSFIKRIVDDELRFHIDPDQGFVLEAGVPEEVDVKAFILTLRYFIQGREPTAFCNLPELMDDPGLSASWKRQVKDIRTLLNCYLDSPPAVNLVLDGEQPTRRWIMEMMVYGDLAHANREKRAKFEAWRHNAIMFIHIQLVFWDVLRKLESAIDCVAHLSRKELRAEAR